MRAIQRQIDRKMRLFARLLPVMLVLLLVGCPKTVAPPEELPPDDNTDEADSGPVDAAGPDAPDAKDVHDVKKDAPDVQVEPDVPVDDDEIDDDAPTDLEVDADDVEVADALVIADVPDVQPLPDGVDAELGPNVDSEIEVGPDVPDGETSGPETSDADVAVIKPLGCQSDSECAGVVVTQCDKVSCLDPGNGVKVCTVLHKDNGVPCDDTKICTQKDACYAGICIGLKTTCNDKNQCTIDTCNENKKVPGTECEYTASSPKPCDDGNVCTKGDTCSLGKCTAGKANACGCKVNSDCGGYSNGDLCLGKLICVLVGVKGTCEIDPASVPAACSIVNDTDCSINTCNPKTGLCGMVAVQNGTVCSDNNACTTPDQCDGGVCKPPVANCDDKNLCTTDSCDPLTGCKHDNNTIACNDGDACTTNDFCDGGACKGTPGNCQCVLDADCDSFEDGDLCNGTLHCVGKKCLVDLTTTIDCTLNTDGACGKHVCTPASGKCTFFPALKGTVCSDGNACTLTDSCNGIGGCVPGKALNCDDGNLCIDDVCNVNVGCLPNLYNDAKCDDGDPCTANDTCAGGKCAGGQNQCACTTDADCAKFNDVNKCLGTFKCVGDLPNTQCQFDAKTKVVVDTSKDNVCSITSCDPKTGKIVVFNFVGPQCNTGKPCQVNGICAKGLKQSTCEGEDKVCDDGNECSVDTCDDAAVDPAKPCVFNTKLKDGLVCVGDKCHFNQVCAAGVCVGSAETCDDKNPCTLDSCEPKSGCTYNAKASGTPCDDNDNCTGDPDVPGASQDGCKAGACVGGAPKDCNDSALCTDDSCDSAAPVVPKVKAGCVYKLNSKPCSDGNACTTGELCAVGACKNGAAVDCDDKNVCTTDSCDKVLGCVHDNVDGPCDDKSVCTEKDKCTAGVCVGAPKDCDDGIICTADSCDPTTLDGCVYAKAVGNCGPLAACNADPKPFCVFSGPRPLFSELYFGQSGGADDWLEIHNESAVELDLSQIRLEAHPKGSKLTTDWVVVVTMPKGQVLKAHGFLLVGNTSPVQNGAVLDVVAPQSFDLLAPKDEAAKVTIDATAGATWRLRDSEHQLTLDTIDASKDVQPANTANSFERKASKTSTQDSMFLHKPEWLAGNGYNSGVFADDFVTKLAPEAQNAKSAQYEPACSGTCGLAKICNYAGVGVDACVDDAKCMVGCGSGKTCSSGAGMCIANATNGVLLSGLMMGLSGEANSQYVEIYNNGTLDIDLSGFVLQRKTADALPFNPWISLIQLPKGLSLPGKHYLTFASQAWAKLHGGVDAMLADSLGLDGVGGALRLWDPGTDTELDSVGWGTAKTFNQKVTKGLTAAGQVLVRKAKVGSTAITMNVGGADYLAGNNQDTDTDSDDFVILPDAEPNSLASGVYEPACAGTCAAGNTCSYVVNAEKCIDNLCGGICGVATGCNTKSGKCDLTVLIAEFATDGPESQNASNAKLLASDNEYVMLYNPTPSSINLAGLVLQGKQDAGSVFVSLTDTVAGVGKKPMTGYIEPYSYYLVVPANYDKNLPAPNLVSTKIWGLYAGSGALRLIRADNTLTADTVAWGKSMNNFAEAKLATVNCVNAEDPKSLTCAMRRKPSNINGSELNDPLSPWYYAGAGYDSNNNSTDFVAINPRQPRNQTCPQPILGGALCPPANGATVVQKL